MKYYFTLVLAFTFIIVRGQVSVPYYESFDNTITGWSHYSTLGQDEWELGTPSTVNINSAWSAPNAWVTDLDDTYAPNSIMFLQTPAFDLSGTSVNYALSFNHRYTLASGTSASVQYSTDNGVTWNTLNSSQQSEKKSWYNSALAFTGTAAWLSSSHSLVFLQGQSSVMFRFALFTGSNQSEGWAVDNFAIHPEYFDIAAVQGDTIAGFSSFKPSFTVTTDIIFNNQYSGVINNTTEYYFSNDTVLDTGDALLGSYISNIAWNYPNYSKTFNTPSNLHAGYYYIFFKHDALNVLTEANESNNAHYAVLEVDSTFNAPYTENFENAVENWEPYSIPANNILWVFGSGYRHHLEGTHSGNKAWHTGLTSPTNNPIYSYLQSPYINLDTLNQPLVMSFWYKKNGNSSSLSVSDGISFTTTLSNIPPCTDDEWDFLTMPLSSTVSSSKHAKFTFQCSPNYLGHEGIMFDDFYIGAAKPDITIERDLSNRFTRSSLTSDTLKYMIANSGMAPLPVTSTAFYWSADSLLDASDILLGIKTEAAMSDTSTMWTSFTYTKPTTIPGKYFIIYIADNGTAVNEMWENNNSGYFTLYQDNTVTVPYMNDFETQVNGWRHNSSLGADDWNWGTPTGSYLSQAFSGTKAWITNAHGDTVSQYSRYHLYTPIFDLSSALTPVIEFDMLHFSGGLSWPYWPYAGGNMSYSVDGGATWMVLDTTSQSFKQWYYPDEYEDYGGIDRVYYLAFSNSYLFDAGEERAFINTTYEYQSRDSKRITRFILDIGSLAGASQVQFRFNYTNTYAPVEGMLIDNFSIRESFTDLEVSYKKNLLISSQDNEVRFYIDIENNGNYISPVISNAYYLSVDSIFDVSDVLLGTNSIPVIRPDRSHMSNEAFAAPSNLGNYRYLIYLLDAGNAVTESNEQNNTGWWLLGMDSVMTLPYLNDFSASVIDGWHWHDDGQGLWHGWRFRHKTVQGEPAWQAQGGEWFLDRFNTTISSYSWLPSHYLESPMFDFTGQDSIWISFDLICIGSNWWSNSSGGNMEYSTDGGNSWQVLPAVAGDVNPYDMSSISTLGNQPGWAGVGLNGFEAVLKNVSFLGNQSNVKFRFHFKSIEEIPSPGIHGLRLDNFGVNALTSDYSTAANFIPVSALWEQPSFTVNYFITNSGASNGRVTNTNFYWSTDSIFDASDPLIETVTEAAVTSGNTLTTSASITYPQPVLETDYYLFYKIDANNDMVETNELNNSGSYKVSFNWFAGMQELEVNSNIYAYEDKIYISLNNLPRADKAFLSLHNTLGQCVYIGEWDINSGDNSTVITRPFVAPGVYHISVVTEEGRIVRKLVLE